MAPAARRRALLLRLALAATGGALAAPGPAARAQAPGPSPAPTPAPASAWRVFPFAQQLDMSLVHDAVHSAPSALLATIARHQVDVRVVRTPAPERPANPLLAGLPEAPAELLRRAEFRDAYEGRVVLRSNAACGLPRDTLLIRDTASSYTLLHEFVQSRLRPTGDCGGVGDDEADIELRFATEFRRLQLYQRRLTDDAFRLLDPRWRADILAALAAVAARLYRRIQIGQSQEAIVEKVLAGAIDERNPYFDAARRAQGLRYGQAMIDNAIDLFNAVDAALAFAQETVGHLREEVRAGRIAPPAPQGLSEADAVAFAQDAARIAPMLARVRTELLALKAFYLR
ncbi:MAG: hypothetical protein JNL30_05975 [Rubrivivax sp.]|nr:hypothetical protein [Rubrivivax sp.]